ncbi:Vegetative storage protein [Heracleum sosnowskyi]|uniref:Vegetative storage protein n=1 Tax=Heracleum sosnowskyi TaxID=360622 RepID=A0AAD8IRQ1_9APIA|nr:Vegetative storage protein [Heracleum sosnowskyi]
MSCAAARRGINSTLTSCLVEPRDYIQLIHHCISSKSLTLAKTIHQQFLKSKFINSPLILEKLTRLYITCNQLTLARRLFNTISEPVKKSSVVLWNHLIRGYAWEGPYNEAIDLYNEMIDIGVRPSKYTYPFVLKACAGLEAVGDGRLVHDHAERNGFDKDVFVSTALVDFYVKCGCLGDARKVFDGMCERDVVAWNAMISGASLHGLYEEMIELVVRMQDAGLVLNSSTVVSVLPAIGEASVLSDGKAVHGYCVRRGFSGEVMVGTGLLDMYAKCGLLDYARKIFGKMGVKNEVSWSAMIGACIICDSTREALVLYDRMIIENAVSPSPVILGIVLRACAKLIDLSKGRRIHAYSMKAGFLVDLMVGNTLLSMYAKCGIIDDATKFLDEMEWKNPVSFSAVISGCVQNGYAEAALKFFQRMQVSKIKPDVATMIGLLPACSYLAALQHGACGHSYSIVRGFSADISICNALTDMYCKCGKVDVARLVFDRMHTRDIVSWNAMIVGYGVHGLGTKAISMFYDMLAEGWKPDDVTFIGLLSACSHSGLVVEGKRFFLSMTQEFNIFPRIEHYLCMVDLLGRAGLLNEAQDFIKMMPIQPDVRIWSALLAACRVHKNVELGEVVSKNIHSLGPESTGNFVLLSNIYSAAGRWDDAADIRNLQRDSGYKKLPGCSWVEINGAIHAFGGGDKSHQHWEEIVKKLEELLGDIKKLGYSVESSFVLHDVEEEEKERILLYHSEKLAVAFAILSLSPSRPILVTKNLRVCGDCHLALTYISMMEKREIIVRDASRFHHFRSGSCSCGGFW